MQVEQIYTGCLSQASYLVISGNEAAIIDPVRDIDLYLQKIKKHGDLKVKYIFETHFHADFVSGHLDLANTLGAEIIFGPEANTAYDIYKGKDGEMFALGDINHDNIIDVLDIILVINIIMQTLEATSDQLWASDFNSDGIVNIQDIILLVQEILD